MSVRLLIQCPSISTEYLSNGFFKIQLGIDVGFKRPAEQRVSIQKREVTISWCR